VSSYDAIAAIYDADMGASMACDDVGWYLRLARAAGGPVLELGCGSGRILAALRAAGVEAIGVDRSLPMLRQARQRCAADMPLLGMDLRALGLRPHFALALLPYSLCTYLLDEQDWTALAGGLRAALRPGARVVVDAFVPRAGLTGAGWLRDYARAHAGHWLVRHKRIEALADASHLIERRYRLRGAFGGRTLTTRERIRPYPPARLVEHCERHLGRVERLVYDYDDACGPQGARFCTAVVAV